MESLQRKKNSIFIYIVKCVFRWTKKKSLEKKRAYKRPFWTSSFFFAFHTLIILNNFKNIILLVKNKEWMVRMKKSIHTTNFNKNKTSNPMSHSLRSREKAWNILKVWIQKVENKSGITWIILDNFFNKKQWVSDRNEQITPYR